MLELLNEFSRMEQQFALAKINVTKFTNDGNKAAGTRLRKNMMELKNGCQNIRTMVSKIKNEETTYKMEAK